MLGTGAFLKAGPQPGATWKAVRSFKMWSLGRGFQFTGWGVHRRRHWGPRLCIHLLSGHDSAFFPYIPAMVMLYSTGPKQWAGLIIDFTARSQIMSGIFCWGHEKLNSFPSFYQWHIFSEREDGEVTERENVYSKGYFHYLENYRCLTGGTHGIHLSFSLSHV